MAQAYYKDDEAAAKYADEVNVIRSKIADRKKKAPVERKAQIVAEADLMKKIETDPSISKDAKKFKKEASLSLTRAREALSMGNVDIILTEKEWEAVFANALGKSDLDYILQHGDPIGLIKMATHQKDMQYSDILIQRVNAMDKAGYTRLQISQHTGLSLADLKDIIEKEKL